VNTTAAKFLKARKALIQFYLRDWKEEIQVRLIGTFGFRKGWCVE